MGLRAQRAKVMKFRDGYLISTGDPKTHYIQESVRHVLMRQGVLGVKVKIMLSYDPTGERGTTVQMPDKIVIHEPKDYTVPEISNYNQEVEYEEQAQYEGEAPVQQNFEGQAYRE